MNFPTRSPKASIVVLCYNGLEECTKTCIESIFAHTAPDSYELILVDNHSSDGTAAYIQSLATQHSHVTAICNDANLGYAAGNNCGIRASAHSFIVLLNNDTVVTARWLESLLAPFEKDEAIALVGPVTNSAGSQQHLCLPGLYSKEWERVAREYTTTHSTLVRECRNLGFFCVAIRKAALDVVGLLDEEYGLGMFEDDDLCLRMREAGYKIVMTDACFVRHLGSYSFQKLERREVEQLFETNRKRFFAKHNCKWTYTDFLCDIFNAVNTDFEYVGSSSITIGKFGRIQTMQNGLAHQRIIEESLRDKVDDLTAKLAAIGDESAIITRYRLLYFIYKIFLIYHGQGMSGVVRAIYRRSK